jgi:hypothetical protein
MRTDLPIKVRLDWSGPGHFDPEHSLSCSECGLPTKMRDNRGRPCHLSCAEQAMAAELGGMGRTEIADERFGYSERELAAELLGQADDDEPNATGERMPTPAQMRLRGGAQ